MRTGRSHFMGSLHSFLARIGNHEPFLCSRSVSFGRGSRLGYNTVVLHCGSWKGSFRRDDRSRMYLCRNQREDLHLHTLQSTRRTRQVDPGRQGHAFLEPDEKIEQVHPPANPPVSVHPPCQRGDHTFLDGEGVAGMEKQIEEGGFVELVDHSEIAFEMFAELSLVAGKHPPGKISASKGTLDRVDRK